VSECELSGEGDADGDGDGDADGDDAYNLVDSIAKS